jgi:Ca2+-binding RTX toxin-like protein
MRMASPNSSRLVEFSPSPDSSILIQPGVGQLIDSSGDIYQISNGRQVSENGKIDDNTSNVDALTIVKGVIWEQVVTLSGPQWLKKVGDTWVAGSNPLTPSSAGANTTTNIGPHPGILVDDKGDLWWVASGHAVENGKIDSSSSVVALHSDGHSVVPTIDDHGGTIGGNSGSNGGAGGHVDTPNYVYTDTSTDQSGVLSGDAYQGPVAGLQSECIYLTSDNINLTAKVASVFLHSGGGNDALQVLGGTNVLDGSTGSNFLVGGSGSDTFFVDDRGSSGDIWSTVVGFHSGDSATVWGVTPDDFKLAWADNQGAAGYTGLTLHATADGKPTASLTLAGYSTNDLNNGRLSVSFGHTADVPNLPGSSFMLIHGN